MVSKNTWVQIHKIILNPEERSTNLPEETKKVPLEMWVKGYLLDDANLHDIVRVKTITGRVEEGTLVAIYPSYQHNYGNFMQEILKVDEIVKQTLYGDEYER